jgi:hypothetical protein
MRGSTEDGRKLWIKPALCVRDIIDVTWRRCSKGSFPMGWGKWRWFLATAPGCCTTPTTHPTELSIHCVRGALHNGVVTASPAL